MSGTAPSSPSPNGASPTWEASPLRRRLLIAEDSDSTRLAFQQMLEADLDVQVDTVGNGTDALQALTQGHYHVLVTDLKMPGLDGMALIEQVQQRHLPTTVIVTTGYGSIEEAVRAIRLGAYDFLTKPIDLQHLRLVIERALRERALQ